jgi:hypothetical protein
VPVIREYGEDAGGTEATFVTAPKESPMHTALHESLHVVICRLEGLDIAEVIDQNDAAWTRLVEPQKFTVAALMAPEVYMILNNIAFTDDSVSSDRKAVADCFCSEAVEDIRQKNRELLQLYFQSTYVLIAIGVLSARMDSELREHKVMSGDSIHEIIDPILKYSLYADRLREKLNEKP